MSLGVSLLRSIVVSIVKRYSCSISNEEVVSIKEDNRGEIGHVQKKDVDESMQLQVGEEHFQSFLIDDSRVESAILFTQRLDCNSTCTNIVDLKNRNKNMRITRNMGNVSASFPLVTSHRQCSRKISRKNKKKSIKISKKNDLKHLEKSELRLQKKHCKN